MAPALTINSPVHITSKLASSPARTSELPPNAPKAPKEHNAFQDLIDAITAILGPTSGLTTEGIDLDGLTKLMTDYVSKEEDWERYAFADRSRGYTRNLVDVGNGKSNLLVLVWSPGKGSLIHDHADAHCLMRILKGTLKETRYALPAPATQPHVIKETTYGANQVTYMSDKLGLHKISNPHPHELAVSLHLYTPPNAAKEGCNVFDERTGRRSHVEQNNYFSVMGVRGGKVEDLM